MREKTLMSGFLFDSEGRLLLLQRNLQEKSEGSRYCSGYYDVPGGEVKLNESHIDALEREFHDEANISISVLSFFYNFFVESETDDLREIVYCYIVQATSSFSSIEFNQKYIRYVFISEDEIDRYPICFQIKTAIKRAFDWYKARNHTFV